ncbi:WD40-repeat-containing domain protein [Crassisporium funariophilum]|nr:WD40-repeat-containing domain protein [Crassisporium funariophilum]
MADDNSQNAKDSKKNIFSRVMKPIGEMLTIPQRSVSPAPSERSKGRSSKSRMRKFVNTFTASQSTMSLPLTSTTENTGRVTPSGFSSTVTAPDSIPPDLCSLMMNSAQYPDHETPPVSSGSHALTPYSPVQDLSDLPPPQGPNTISFVVQPPEPTSTSARMEGDPHSSKPHAGSSLKNSIELTGRALQTLVKRASNIVDTNPAKIALGLVKAIVEIKDAVKDNKDAVARQIASTGGQLEEVADALHNWQPHNEEANPWMIYFKATLEEELQKLRELDEGSNFRKFLDHEDEQTRIKDIFMCINEARVRFELALGIRVFKAVYKVDKAVKDLFLDRLKPSDIAHHDYLLEGEEGRILRRQVCTPGTRVRILHDIVTWAKDTSPEGSNVYWLFGHAGSGKTTLAYTIARRFEFAGDSENTIILGGNFFCSRQFTETSLSKYIIRTIAYHLALKCRPFSDALIRSGRLDTITQNRRSQLDGLLFGPWQESEAARRADTSTPLHYLIVIDALDEIDGTGGSEFLRDLVDAINNNKEKCFASLKFLVTSRSDQVLVDHVRSLKRKQLYRLQDVKEEEARADVAIYLNASLPRFQRRPEMDQLVSQAAGLFIYAATVVKLLAGRQPLDQKNFLKRLFTTLDPAPLQMPLQDPEALLNQLYYRILEDAFGKLREDERACRLLLLYTFLCAREPLSTSSATSLIFTEDPEETDPEFSYTKIADEVLSRLHSVLYVRVDKAVLSYHKSFPDFIFDLARSGRFWCDKAKHHRHMTVSCFQVMQQGLRFNIANIPSSFIFDRDNHMLVDEVKENIPPVLNYSCQNWDHHLSRTVSSPFEPLHTTLSEFLQLRALFWIEAMNLLNSRGRCSSMFQTAREWVIESKGKSPLPENLFEAGSFALYVSGGGTWSSTPHLYLSALATWPRKADPIQSWKSHFCGIPKFTNAFMGGTLLMTLNTNTSISSVAFSSDGSRIVSGSIDRSVRVWDASTGEEKHVLNGHTLHVTSVAFSNDGSCIVSGSRDKSVRVWDASTGEEKHVLYGHTDGVNSVAFSSDGTCIVSGSIDKSVRVWDASTGEEKHVLNGHRSRVRSVAFSSDGSRIVSGSEDKSVRVSSVAFSSDGTCIVSGSNDNSVRVWDASTGEEKHVLNGHRSMITSVAFSNDGSRIVSGSRDKSVRVWDASTGEEKHVLYGHTDVVNSVAFSSDGSRIVSGSDDKSVRVWDASTGEEKHVLKGHRNWIISVAFSSDGSRIVSGANNNSVLVWDASTGQGKRVLNGHEHFYSVAFSSDGSRIVSGYGSTNNSIRVWDASTGEEKHVLNGHTGLVSSVAFSSDGGRIVSGSMDNSVRVWNASKHSVSPRYIRELGMSVHDVQHTGWLLTPGGEGYLMFVPPSERLPDDDNILTFPPSFCAHVDFTDSRVGPAWTTCYSAQCNVYA